MLQGKYQLCSVFVSVARLVMISCDGVADDTHVGRVGLRKDDNLGARSLTRRVHERLEDRD